MFLLTELLTKHLILFTVPGSLTKQVEIFHKVFIFPLQSQLQNMQWHDVQQKLIEAQRIHHMCVHKAELTELGEDTINSM